MKTKSRAQKRLAKKVEVLRTQLLDVARACRGLAPVTDEITSVIGSEVSSFLAKNFTKNNPENERWAEIEKKEKP